MTPEMEYSATGLLFTEGFEGLRLEAYPDTATGGEPWTIGYGHTGGVREGDVCTKEQAELWLMEDVSDAVAAVNRLVRATLTQGEFDACVDFTFNAGEGNFAKSTLLRDLNLGSCAAAKEEFKRWDMAGGAHVAGLERRRLAEAKEFGESEGI